MSLSYRMAKQAPVCEQRRKAVRRAARMRTVALESDIFIETVSLVDIGRLGFSVRTLVGYPTGCRLVLHIAGREPILAFAVWHGRGRAGARFCEPLDEESLLSLIATD